MLPKDVELTTEANCSELMFAMDYSGQRENGRHKQDHYKPQQWLLPGQIMKDPPHELIMKFLNERDIAIQERNLAISEKKSALAERDMAIMQRDAAISERNNALMERDNAMAALAYRENSALNNMSTCPPGCGIPRGAKHIHQQQHMHHHQPQFADPPYNSREIHIDDAIPISAVPTEAVKPKRGKRTKELKSIPPKKVSKPSKKGRKGGGDLNNQVTVAKPYEWKNEQFMGGSGEDFNKQHSGSTPEWKGSDLGLSQVNFEDSTVPVPVCSCTGVLQPCYKWGKGGWQSACCTTTLSMYPLPVMPNKRNSRLGGRKMSGGAFAKLLCRLAAEGHDVSTPLDLKDHWSKHGTNRYITIK